jgi:hypothetical protein
VGYESERSHKPHSSDTGRFIVVNDRNDRFVIQVNGPSVRVEAH